MIALIFALGLASQAQGAPRDPLYIIGDVVRVRAEPSETGSVIARLRNGSPVQFLEERGTWLKVNAAPDDKEPFIGWVQSSLVSAEYVNNRVMLARGMTASGAERVLWLERVAARGEDPSVLPKLRDAYREVGDTKRAATMQARIDGAAPMYVGACVGGETQLLAILEGTKVRALAGHVGDDLEEEEAKRTPLVKELEALRVTLTGTAELWQGGWQVAQPRFQRPRVQLSSSVVGTSAVLVIGKCPEADSESGVGYASIITNAPLSTPSITPALDAAMAKKLLAEGPASDVRAVLVADRFVDTRVSEPRHRRQLLTKKGVPLARELSLPWMNGTWRTLPSGASLFVASNRADEVESFGWPAYGGMGEVIFDLVVVDEELGVTHTPVQVYQAGC